MKFLVVITIIFVLAIKVYAQSYNPGLPLPGLPKSLGQKPMSGSTSVTIASDQTAIAISGSITADNASVGVNGNTAPTSSTEVGGIDNNGKLSPLKITGQGITVSAFQNSNPWVISGGVAITGSSGAVIVTQGTNPWVISGGVALTVTPTVNQGTSPWVTSISGNVPVTQVTSPWVTSNVNGVGITNTVTITGTVQTLAPLNSTAYVNAASISTTTTVTAIPNSVEVIIEALDTNTANLRVAFGATASEAQAVGLQLQPGRSEVFHTKKDVSICPASGTQGYVIQWIGQ